MDVSWTIKKAECQRIDAFELQCWRRLLRVPWTARRSNQSIRKEISPKYSLDRLMLKLKLQYFSHRMWRAGSLEKTLMLGKTEGRRRRGQKRTRQWIASPTQWTAASQASPSITNSWSLLKFMSIRSVMPSTTSSSIVPFSSCLQSFPASGSFPISQFFVLGGQSNSVSASASVLPMNI